MSPTIPLLLLLLVAGLVAYFACRTMFRRGLLTRVSAGVLAVLLTLVMLPVLMAAWTAWAPSPRQIAFDASDWRERPSARWAMTQDLLTGGVREGMTQAEVRRMLGDRDGSYDAGDAYVLWRPRDAFELIPPEFVVVYDKSGRVDRCWIEPSWFDILLRGADV